jgi:hypothetical protein
MDFAPASNRLFPAQCNSFAIFESVTFLSMALIIMKASHDVFVPKFLVHAVLAHQLFQVLVR